MTDTNVIKLAQPGTFTDSLTEILRNGARALLTQAVETEVADFLGRYADLKTAAGHQRVVRHGHLPERKVMTGIGSVAVRQPRVRDRESDEESKEGAMTEHIPTPLATRRLVGKHEELRRKREGTWDPTTMVSQTSPEGAALRGHRASPDKVTDAQPIASELLKNEAPPKFKAACEFTTEKPQGDGEDHAGLVEVAGDHSPPHEPTSLPTSKAEPLQPVKEVTSEAEKPKTETTPLAAIGGKPGRSGGGQPKKERPPVGIPKSTPKLSPKIMRIILNVLRERPILYLAALAAGIHPKTLAYWIGRSEAGDDGYDVKWRGLTRRFHEHCESAIDEAHQKLENEWIQRALHGYEKVLTHRGRVIYKIDQELVGLGLEGPDAYLKDENGKPIPETVHKEDPKAQLHVLKRFRPNTYNRPKVDAPREGGVLVIGDAPKKPKCNTAKSVRARKWKADSRRIREEKE